VRVLAHGRKRKKISLLLSGTLKEDLVSTTTSSEGTLPLLVKASDRPLTQTQTQGQTDRLASRSLIRSERPKPKTWHQYQLLIQLNFLKLKIWKWLRRRSEPKTTWRSTEWSKIRRKQFSRARPSKRSILYAAVLPRALDSTKSLILKFWILTAIQLR